MRTFIAVDFQTEILDKIEQIGNYFKTQTPVGALKWVAKENLHLTLKFIGEVSPAKINEIKTLTGGVLISSTSFGIEIKGLGLYPTVNKPRVIWLGIENNLALVNIHKRLDQALSQAHIKPDNRPFSPHLTIARVRRNTPPDQVRAIGKTISQFKVGSLGISKIETIRIYQSKLNPQGPTYSPLMTIRLNQV